MNGKKTEKTNFINKKLKVMSVSEFDNYLKEIPLKDDEKSFLTDIYHGLSYEELSEKYEISTSRVYKKKRNIYEKLYDYENRIISIPVENNNNTEIERVDIEELISKKIEQAFSSKEKELKQVEEHLNAVLEKTEKKRIDKKLQEIKKSQNLNSRGTKKADPIEIKDKVVKEDIEKLSSAELKKKYIPMYARGELSAKETGNILGITIQQVSVLKKKYLIEGEDCSFEHKNKGKEANNKTPDEIVKKIESLYLSEYKEFPISDFQCILKEKYSIDISYNTLRNIIKSTGFKSPTADKYFGTSKETLGNDFIIIMELFSASISKEKYTELEEYGLIQLCDLAFNKSYLALNSISKKKYKLSYRTSYSLFTTFIEKGYLDIKESWTYWNKNHDKFSYIYNKPTRYKLIEDIRNIYYPMFKSIEDFILKEKEKL